MTALNRPSSAPPRHLQVTHDVFISHSSRDKAVADAICATLEASGIRCWIAPRDLIAGRPFSGEIIRGIKCCRVMVLLFSSHSNASQEVLREVQLATQNRLHLVNFRIENSKVSDDLAYFLGIPHWLDAINEPTRESHGKLVESVQALLALPAPEAPPMPPADGAPSRSSHVALPKAPTPVGRWAAIGAAALALIGGAIYLLRDQPGSGHAAPPSATPAGSPAARPLDDLSALTGASGLIADPKTPEQHYRNARIHELGGNTSAARKEYAAFLESDLDMLDAWLNYSSMLKIQEGRDGALENLRTLGGKSKSVSSQIAAALLEENEPRLAKLIALEKEHPGFGPLPWLISQEFSEQKRGTPTLAETRSEREWLEKFRAAHAAGKFVKFFFDKKESEKWLTTADGRWAKVSSVPADVLKDPVKLSLQQSSEGWVATFQLSDGAVKQILYQLDGQGEFLPTGSFPQTNPLTGMPTANPTARFKKLSAGDHTLAVKYVDKNNQTNGPYELKFNTAAAIVGQARQILDLSRDLWLYFKETDDQKLQLYFVRLLIHRPALEEIRYSLNSDLLDQKFEFEPTDTFMDPGPKMSTFVPADTKFACVQVTYKDGTKSPIQRFER